MRVRRYYGTTMQEAVAQVRADFGPEAVILQTRRVRQPGIWGLLGRRRVEVIAALDKPAQRQSRDVPRQVAPETEQPLAVPWPPRQWSPESTAGAAAKKEHLSPPTLQPGAGLDLQRLRMQLVELGLPAREADDIVREIETERMRLPTIGGDRKAVGDALVRSLAARICTVEPWQLNNPPYFAALVGPTGVGKTTTVAKLAANYALVTRKQVALIAADTYRVGAVEQLREYADLIGIPLEVVENKDQMAAAAQKFATFDLVLVDTVGRSQRDDEQIAELRRLVGALPSVECHLVVSATTRLQDLADIIERFSVLKPATVIVTKVDETTSPVTVFNAARLSGCPLSFITAGQRVPEDIEVAEPLTVAQAIVGGLE